MTHVSKKAILGTVAFSALLGGCATSIEMGPGYYHYDTRAAGSPPAVVYQKPAAAPTVVYREPAVVVREQPTVVLREQPTVVVREPTVVYRDPTFVYRDPAVVYYEPTVTRRTTDAVFYKDHGQ